jgi:hypothetical protein
MAVEMDLALIKEQQEVKAKYPHTLAVVKAVVCIQCLNRGYRSGCKYNLLPVTKEGKFCPKYVQWGNHPIHSRNSAIKEVNQQLKLPHGDNLLQTQGVLDEK